MSGPNMKYTLYLDSSGDPGWPPPWGLSQSKLYILGGIVLTPTAESVAMEELKTLIEKHFENIQKPNELKYTWIVQGKKPPFNLLNDEQKKNLIDDVFSLIIRLQPIILCSIVDKEKMRQKYGTLAFNPKTYAITSILSRFSMTLKGRGNFGEVIMDDENVLKDKDLQNDISKRRKFGMIIRGATYNPMASERLEPIINSLLFSKSEDSPGIQLADFAMKAVWNKYLYGKDARFLQIQQFFDKSPSGSPYEPCLLPR